MSGRAGCGCGVQCGMPRHDGVDEGPSEDDLQRFGGEMRPCPACRAEMYDDSEWCPKCGHVLGSEPVGVSWFAVVVSGVLVGVVVWSLLR